MRATPRLRKSGLFFTEERNMHRAAWRTWLVAGVSGLCLFGCGEKSAIHKQVRDPLLISKKPIEGRSDQPAPVHLTYAEPSPPPVPDAAVATAPVRLQPISAGDVERAARPAVDATPAVRKGPTAAVPAETVSRREPASIYGHAA